MKRTEYDAATKAQVMAALLAGQGISEVAKTYSVPIGTVKSWQARMRGNPSEVAKVASEKREEIGDLLIEYLHANLATLRKQTVAFAEPTWLAKQNAADMAVLHGVITDKSMRLLEALGGNGSSEG